MIVGAVINNFDAMIEVTVYGSDGQAETIEALIDTGFTGQLTLPPETIAGLSLAARGTRSAILADGRIVLSNAFVASADWDGIERRIQVIESPGVPLVAMRLLRGFRVRIDVEPHGRVSIDQLNHVT